ncbi:MAG: hypothetical protein L0207_04710, partial [Chlamydiae bacterium]|nr:hypothetical protein [Chlamydiota bacterium]
AIVPLNENQIVSLKRIGKHWQYLLPKYSEEDILLLKTVVWDWLFEIGAVAIGWHEDKECFRVTNFGQTLFQ